MSKHRFVVFGDLHYAAKPPRCRAPEYMEEIRTKLGWVRGVCRKLDAQAIHTGDLFHRPRPHLDAIESLAGVLKLFAKPVYTLIGNHDLINHTTHHGTGFGCLLAAGLVRLLPTASPLTLPGGFAITANHYEEDERPDLYERVTGKDTFEVRVTHGMLMEDDRDRPFPFTPVSAVEHAPDVLVNGHYHEPWSRVAKVNGKARTTHNIGSLSRVAKDQTSPRQILIIEWNDEAQTCRVIVKRVPSIDEPFRDIEVADNTSRIDGESVTEFAEAMRESAVETTVDPVLMLEQIHDKLSPGAYNKARGYLLTARERLT